MQIPNALILCYIHIYTHFSIYKSSETVCKYLMQWFLLYSYIRILALTDQGSQFTSKMRKELSSLLEFRLEHATLKHAQTIRVVDRSHGPLKRYLKVYENEIQQDWHKSIDLVVFQHDSSY